LVLSLYGALLCTEQKILLILYLVINIYTTWTGGRLLGINRKHATCLQWRTNRVQRAQWRHVCMVQRRHNNGDSITATERCSVCCCCVKRR